LKLEVANVKHILKEKIFLGSRQWARLGDQRRARLYISAIKGNVTEVDAGQAKTS
jgi:hypothetical protein